jgi:Bacterial TSP3 repeat
MKLTPPISKSSMAAAFLLICLSLLALTHRAHAIADANQNGVSDVWEKKYNQGNLFPTFDPLSDADGDGWTAAQEAAAGTDPFNASSSSGLIRPTLTPIATGNSITWPTLAGKKYTLFASPDLAPNSWTAVGASSIGTGADLTRQLPLDPATNLFWRVAVTDTDLDNDGLTDAEELQIGSSIYLPDTNSDGTPDVVAYTSGQNPAGEDADGDSIPDDALYSAQFEITNDKNYFDNVGLEAFAGVDNSHRYLTKKTSVEYSISGSPNYSNITNGKYIKTESYLKNGAISSHGYLAIEYEGVDETAAYLANRLPPLSSQEELSHENSQLVITGPIVSPTEIVTTRTETTSWTIKNLNHIVVRSGTEIAIHTDREKLLDSVTVQEFWTNKFKTIPWTSDLTLNSVVVQGPQVGGMQQARLGLGDVVVAGILRDFYKNGDFNISSTLSWPYYERIEYSSTNIAYWLGEIKLKSLRWRWVRFNPRTPFDYVYAAPPASYQQKFHLLVEQKDTTSLPPGYSPTTAVTTAKGIVEINCQGSEGGGWHTVDPSKFAPYRIENPVNLTDFDYIKSGESKVTLSNLPIPVVSRDKFLAGSFKVPDHWNKLEVEIIGPDGSLGKSSDLLGSGATKVYDKFEDVLKGSDYATGCQPATQKVWFVRDAPGSRVINFYTCFNSVGAVKIKLYKDGKPQPLEINHTLTAAPDFAAVIHYVNQWVKGTSFGFDGGTPPLNLRFSSKNIPLSEEIDYLSSACLIAFFNTIQQVEGLTGVVIGLLDGIKAGVIDDKQFIEFVVSNIAYGGTYSYLLAKAEIDLWRTDPLKRATEMTNMTRQFVQDVVFKKLEATRQKLSTWNGFKDEAWKHLQRIGSALTLQYTIPIALWPSLVDGFCEWNADFNSRMLIGGEKAAFENTAWIKNKLLASGTDPAVFDITGVAIRTFGYATGYSSGYIIEQVAVGALTLEAGNIAKASIKGGVSLASNLSLRTAFAISSRSHLLKRTLAEAAVSLEMEAAAARGLKDAARLPISTLYHEIPGEAIEQAMRRPAFNRTTFNLRLVGEEVAKSPRLQALFLIEQTETRFWTATGKFVKSLGEETSAEAMKGWVKAYDRCLKIEGGALLDDRAEDLFKLVKVETLEGKKALRKSLEEFGATDGSGKFWLRDVEKIQAEGYRYSNFDPRFDVSGNPVAGPPKLTASAAPSGGWYATFEKLETSSAAKERLQLPQVSTVKFRLEFDWDAVKNNVRVPRGRNHSAEWFESLAKDYPEYGLGGGLQVVVDGVDIPIRRIWDISGSTSLQVYP